MQALIGRPISPIPGLKPETTADWKAIVDEAAVALVTALPKIRGHALFFSGRRA
jgi:hypothetical protein